MPWQVGKIDGRYEQYPNGHNKQSISILFLVCEFIVVVFKGKGTNTFLFGFIDVFLLRITLACCRGWTDAGVVVQPDKEVAKRPSPGFRQELMDAALRG